jgi:hypothetical protein
MNITTSDLFRHEALHPMGTNIFRKRACSYYKTMSMNVEPEEKQRHVHAFVNPLFASSNPSRTIREPGSIWFVNLIHGEY